MSARCDHLRHRATPALVRPLVLRPRIAPGVLLSGSSAFVDDWFFEGCVSAKCRPPGTYGGLSRLCNRVRCALALSRTDIRGVLELAMSKILTSQADAGAQKGISDLLHLARIRVNLPDPQCGSTLGVPLNSSRVIGRMARH